jgi:SAM-dependent methyltransferase
MAISSESQLSQDGASAAISSRLSLSTSVRLWLADHLSPGTLPGTGLPLPPALLRYRVSELLSTEMFLRVGEGCALHIDKQVQTMGMSFPDVERVLDFGCGCGRTVRWLMERYPATHFYGADVDGDAIEWCAQNLHNGAFVKNRPEPPLPFQSGYFDVVYCFSVFTHLDERMQDMWLIEIKRILKPGGIVILTVYGEKTVCTLGDEAADVLKGAGFMHRRSRKLSGIVPDWYNTSWHSQTYIVARLDALFTDVRYTVVPDGSQDLVVARNL